MGETVVSQGKAFGACRWPRAAVWRQDSDWVELWSYFLPVLSWNLNKENFTLSPVIVWLTGYGSMFCKELGTNLCKVNCVLNCVITIAYSRNKILEKSLPKIYLLKRYQCTNWISWNDRSVQSGFLDTTPSVQVDHSVLCFIHMRIGHLVIHMQLFFTILLVDCYFVLHLIELYS
jgi:hypothetical protein